MADALVVAGVAGGEAWQRAQREYFKRSPRPYMRLVSAIQDNDFLGAPLSHCLIILPSAVRANPLELLQVSRAFYPLQYEPVHWNP